MSKTIGLVLGIFILAFTLCVPLTHAISFPHVMNDYNGMFFENAEVLIDRDGDGEVSVGDTFWGIVSAQNIKAPTDPSGTLGPNIWMQHGSVPPAEITGYFVMDVLDILPVGHEDNPYAKTIIVFAPAADDPNGLLNTAAGEVMRLFIDNDGPYYDNSTQALGVATATNGTHIWSLGMGASTDGDSQGGYYYSLSPVVPPGSGSVGKAYGGFNFISIAGSPDGEFFEAINDPDEDWSTWDFVNHEAFGNGRDVEFWFNSELTQINSITNTTHFHFTSEDPAVYKPVEEELPGDCRVTAGGNKDGIPCDLKPNGTPDNNCAYDITHTWGGQAGASGIDGNWTHHYKESNKVSFLFHSNTVFCIECSDPGYCDPARPAPYHQIHFAGIGQFNNKKGFDENFPVGEDRCFEVHLEDISEPGPGGKWPSSDSPCEHCPGTSIVHYDPVTGQNDCEDCTDYYEIKIYKDAGYDEVECKCTGDVLWVNGSVVDPNCGTEDPKHTGFFTRAGNVQIHPAN